MVEFARGRDDTAWKDCVGDKCGFGFYVAADAKKQDRTCENCGKKQSVERKKEEV